MRVLDLESGRPRVAHGARTVFLSHYFQSARAGAVRIGAASDNERVAPLAFVNGDGSIAVVIKTRGRAKVALQGSPRVRMQAGSRRSD